MNNKGRIEECLREFTIKIFDGEDIEGIETKEIATALNLRRNVVSHYLNILVSEEKVIKTKTRPVYFVHKEILENYKNEQKKIDEIKSRDAFSELVGHNGSLKIAVEQCKSAAFYPSDMPILFTGKSGVGKSYLASLVCKYAIENGKIDKSAPFVTLNCADYADNPELLGANLFGYKKGAFTGADKDKKGLIESANGGYLFLDEVHRLSPEGQEKLFVFMDKGVYKRIGESSVERHARVKCLFATTENPQETLLGTFVRRIPLLINIPSLDERSLDERITLIHNFFLKEAISIDRNLKVHKSVINYILSQEKKGNVGSVKNIVKLLCAYVYKSNIDKDTFSISLKNISHLVKIESVEIREYYTQDYLIINKDENAIFDSYDEDELTHKQTKKEFDEIISLIKRIAENKISLLEFRKSLNSVMNRYLNIMVYSGDSSLKNDLVENLYRNNIANTLKIIEERYGFKYYGNTSKILSKVLLFLNRYDNYALDKEDKGIIKVVSTLNKILSKEYIIADKILTSLNINLDFEITDYMRLFVSLYVFTLTNNSSTNINAIIVAHGYSTASSIASVANQLYGEFIFDAFDMPIDMSPSEIKRNVKKYIENMDDRKDLIILVDMGSLFSIDDVLMGTVKGDIGVINNITTNIALDIAGKIINDGSLEEMLSCVEKNARIECKYIKSSKKKKAILTTCISGIGTSVKIKELLKKCIGDVDIEIIPYEYGNLASKGSEDKVFYDYDVKLIISTTKLEIDGVNIMMLDNLMSTSDNQKFYSLFEGILDEQKINDIKQDLVKMFSMQNVINQLTILNPDKIINEVEIVICNMENYLDKKFTPDLRMILYIHISIMIERLILKQGLVSLETQEEYKKHNMSFVELVEKAFSITLKEYNLELTIKEIEIIQGIIESRIGRLEF